MNKLTSILLVEDDEDDQEFFIEALSKIKNVTLYGIVNNGKEALDTLENSAILPDFIITDINMPTMGGIECLTRIINTPRTKHIPVVMLSTDLTKKDLVLKLGAKAFIPKTFDGKSLYGQLEQMIGLHSTNAGTQSSLSFHHVSPIPFIATC